MNAPPPPGAPPPGAPERASPGGWRNVFALGLVSFFTDLSTEMIYPLLPAFLVSLGAGASFLGAIEGAAESVSSLLKLASGWVADRTRARRGLMLGGYTLSSLSKPLVALAAAPWHVLAIRLADRTGKGIRSAPRDALLADSVTPKERGRAFGLQRTMDHAGAICGPLVAAALLATLANQYRLVFALASIPALLSVLCILVGVREVAPRATKAVEEGKQAPRLSGLMYRYLVVVFVFTLGNSSDAFVLLRARDLGLSDVAVPLAWVALHIVKMVFSVPGGMLSDRIGRRATIVTGWLIYAGTYAGLAVASAPLHAWLLFCVYGLYFALTEGVEKAFVADLAGPETRGRAFGAFHFAIGIGALPAGLIMGLLWDRRGPGTAFGTGAALALLAGALLLALVRPGRRGGGASREEKGTQP